MVQVFRGVSINARLVGFVRRGRLFARGFDPFQVASQLKEHFSVTLNLLFFQQIVYKVSRDVLKPEVASAKRAGDAGDGGHIPSQAENPVQGVFKALGLVEELTQGKKKDWHHVIGQLVPARRVFFIRRDREDHLERAMVGLREDLRKI